MADFLSGFYGNVNDEVALVCAHLKALKSLESGFNLVGFSQGGQFARAVVQRCRHEGLDIKSLITFGGQHQGVSNLPGCQVTSTEQDYSMPTHGICKALMQGAGRLVYMPFVRTHVIQAQYFKAPFNMKAYLRANPFLPDLNNERPDHLKDQYRDNMLALDNFAMIRFHDDITVVPRDSAWFSWYDGKRVVPLQEQHALWHEDRLGLRQLHTEGKLHFDEVPGGHMQFSWEDLVAMLDKYMSLQGDETASAE